MHRDDAKLSVDSQRVGRLARVVVHGHRCGCMQVGRFPADVKKGDTRDDGDSTSAVLGATVGRVRN